MEKKIELTFVTLDCGHSVAPEVGMGVCSKCGKTCCSRCLQPVNGELFCPECFLAFVRRVDES